MPAVEGILKAISNKGTLNLFDTIAVTGTCDLTDLTKQIKLTRKQYYSRMHALRQAGLIKRTNGKYSLTSCGKVVYNAQRLIENGLNNIWKLRAIDSLEIFDDEFPKEEHSNIISIILENQKIKEIIEKSIHPTNATTIKKQQQ
jgi:DNA-binding HxlR family transcriptional regulator